MLNTTSILLQACHKYFSIFFSQKIFYFLGVLAFYAQKANAQHRISRTEVTFFSRVSYAAGTQNWAMAIDINKRLYIANNEGLLIYNGTNWQLYPLPNKTILRAIAFGNDGKLYAGAQDEFGFFAPDNSGRIQYTSLKKFLPASQSTLADVWDIEITGDEVFFRANDKMIRWANGRLDIYKPIESWLSLSKHGETIIAQDGRKGVFVFKKGKWLPLIDAYGLPAGFLISDLTTLNKDTAIISTTSNGLFILAENRLEPFTLKGGNAEQHFISLALLDENTFLAGSYANGIYKINRDGQVTEIIADESGLQNKTIRCMNADTSGNVWIGLDNGIAFMNCNDAIRHINPSSFNNGSGYSAVVVQNDLFFALSTGLQYLPISANADLSTITGEPAQILNGLTWNLSVINNKLLSGRDDGAWMISDHRPQQISAGTGYWIYKPVSSTLANRLVAGNYNGISLLQENDKQFIGDGDIPGFHESSRYVETDDRIIWVSHPYRGVFKINVNNNAITKFSSADGLPSDLDNHVFKLKNRVVFATLKGIYEYNTATKKMVPAARYSNIFGQMPLRYLKEDEKGNIWFVQDKMIGVADFSGPQPVINFIPELKNKILSGFENIYPYNTSNVLVGSESGFYHIDYEKYRKKIMPLKTYLTAVRTIGEGDSIIYGGYSLHNQNKAVSVLPYTFNALHFSFAASVTGMESGPEFSFYLEGFDKEWSNWSTQYEKEYTNLYEGNYVFHVKSRNRPFLKSAEYTYAFIISPPWYRTIWAYIMYAMLFVCILFMLYRIQDKNHRKKQQALRLASQQKLEEEQRRLNYLHQLEIEKTEKELIRLKNENLEAEIEHKNAELASTAMTLVQKKEFLLKLTNELNKLYKPGSETINTAELKKIIRSLSSEEKLDEEWKQFSIHFNNVHSNFLITLKEKFPMLNAHELKLCAYLRMNLSSKEMAQLMSITVRGVEISRYRLRKKLQLQPKEDLFRFLLNIESAEKENEA